MEEAMYAAAHYLVLALEALALLVVAGGAGRAVSAIGLALMHRQLTDARLRAIFSEFARWLVAGLSFQLAADIAATTVAPDWEDLGWLVSVALLRTLLTYSLERDLERARAERAAPSERRHAQALPD
jgi:uncharacterized membrane protein